MTTVYVGQIELFAFNFAPRNWALCNGRLMSIQQNQALFARCSAPTMAAMAPRTSRCQTCRAASRWVTERRLDQESRIIWESSQARRTTCCFRRKCRNTIIC